MNQLWSCCSTLLMLTSMLCPLRSPMAGGVGHGRAATMAHHGSRSEALQRQSGAVRVGARTGPATRRPWSAVPGPTTSESVGADQSYRRRSVGHDSQVGRTVFPARGAVAVARGSACRRISRGVQQRNQQPGIRLVDEMSQDQSHLVPTGSQSEI